MNTQSVTAEPKQLAIPDREVRRLLRSLRKPKSLESQALAMTISEHVNAANCHDAVMLFLERAFNEYGQEGRKLFDLLRRADMEGIETHAAIAASMHLSTRQFYRYRSNAVHIIVRALRDLLAQSKDEPLTEVLARSVESIDPGIALELHSLNSRPNAVRNADVERLRSRLTTVLEAYGKSGDATRLANSIRDRVHFHNNEHRPDVLAELAYRDYLFARQRSNFSACAEALKELRKGSSASRRAEAIFTLCDAEASFRFFNASDAIPKLRTAVALACKLNDITLQCTAILILAEALLCTGNIKEAAQLVKALDLCSPVVPHIVSDVAALKNRIALREGNCSVVPHDGTSLESYGDVMLAVTWARLCFVRGNIEQARALAERILPVADAEGYRIPQIWCLALLGEVRQARIALSEFHDAFSSDALDEQSVSLSGAVVHGLTALALRKGRVA